MWMVFVGASNNCSAGFRKFVGISNKNTMFTVTSCVTLDVNHMLTHGPFLVDPLMDVVKWVTILAK